MDLPEPISLGSSKAIASGCRIDSFFASLIEGAQSTTLRPALCARGTADFKILNGRGCSEWFSSVPKAPTPRAVSGRRNPVARPPIASMCCAKTWSFVF